jgi:hypothetical protein
MVHAARMRYAALALVVPLIAAGAAGGAPARSHADCTRTSTAMVPLTDLGRRTYQGFRGGLYPGARNAPSPKYLQQGVAAARAVAPMDGKIVVLSIGMSNTTAEFSTFQFVAQGSHLLRPSVLLVDGAQGGQDATRLLDPNAPFWSGVEQRLTTAGASDAQVQVVWLKEAIAGPTLPFPADAKQLEADLVRIVLNLEARFPNLRLVYLSSRTYAGYATTALNPEPYAYQSGFAVRWTIARRIDGRLRGAWLGWGPYLWTNGTTGRRDGLTWRCDDVASDGTHPSQNGRLKVAQLLLQFFTTDPTAKTWFSG